MPRACTVVCYIGRCLMDEIQLHLLIQIDTNAHRDKGGVQCSSNIVDAISPSSRSQSC